MIGVTRSSWRIAALAFALVVALAGCGGTPTSAGDSEVGVTNVEADASLEGVSFAVRRDPG